MLVGFVLGLFIGIGATMGVFAAGLMKAASD